jgi:hypothetical protein
MSQALDFISSEKRIGKMVKKIKIKTFTKGGGRKPHISVPL